MPTFMTQPTHDALSAVWHRLAAEHAVAGGIGPSFVFIPWAGEQLVATSRGIYYVGIATDADEAGGEPNFELGLQGTERFTRQLPLGNAPFWRFLDRLSRAILNAPYSKTQQQWGWSNLLKIAGTVGRPDQWPTALIEKQRGACITAFQEEIGRLRDSLIVVASERDYGILYESVAESEHWDRQSRESEIYTLHDPGSGNVYAHCYHPNYLAHKHLFEAAVADVVQLARDTLPPFSFSR